MLFDISGSNKIGPEKIECDVCYEEYDTLNKKCNNKQCTFNICENCTNILPRPPRTRHKECPQCKSHLKTARPEDIPLPLTPPWRVVRDCWPRSFVCCCIIGHCSITEWNFIQRCTPQTATCCCLGIDFKFENNNHPRVSRCEVGCCDGHEVCSYVQRNFLEQTASLGVFILFTIAGLCCVKCTGNFLLHIFANHPLTLSPHDCYVGYHSGKMCMDCCVGFWTLCGLGSCMKLTQDCCSSDIEGAEGQCCGSYLTCMYDPPRAVMSQEPIDRA